MIFYHLAVTLFLLIVTVNIAVNWFLFVAPRPRRFDVAGAVPGDVPLVSILVPARNEAVRIGPCLQSLDRQDYPNFEVIVLDDNSEDGTARVIAELGFNTGATSSRRLLPGEPLPAGWTGKAWACHQLAAAARGSYLLFTDADTVHDPRAVGACVGHAQDTGAGLLSAWPRQITRTWSECAVIPLVYVLLLGALPHGILIYLQRRPDKARQGRPEWLRALGAANGQFMLFRRDIYELIGGHAAVRDHLVEDVLLGRLVAERTGDGVKLVNVDGSQLVRCRMYNSFADLWAGFTKNLRPVFSASQRSFWLFGLLQACGLFFPFVLACLPWLSGRWWWVPVAQVAWLYAIRAVLTARFRTSWWGAWLHPVGHGLSLLIGLNSWRLSSQKGVVWKGRVYTMQHGTGGVSDFPAPPPPLPEERPAP
jgi:chlorobactene glucosyltransferase